MTDTPKGIALARKLLSERGLYFCLDAEERDLLCNAVLSPPEQEPSSASGGSATAEAAAKPVPGGDLIARLRGMAEAHGEDYIVATEDWERTASLGQERLYREAADAIESLERELAAAQKDAERLDWLEQLDWPDDAIGELVRNWRDPDGKRHQEGLRAAIDAAKGAENE